jgi:hypothetical protein
VRGAGPTHCSVTLPALPRPRAALFTSTEIVLCSTVTFFGSSSSAVREQEVTCLETTEDYGEAQVSINEALSEDR